MGGLRIETSLNESGKIFNEHSIPLLRETDYRIKTISLEGDAPRQFIKAYFYEKDSVVRKNSPTSWTSFIAKTAEKWYPHESIIEYLINRIGQELGLYMNDIKLVRAYNQIRFLSKYFRNKNERLIHGAEICGEHLRDMDMAKEIADNRKTSRQLFTFEFIESTIREVFPKHCDSLLCSLIKLITFDGIVGNVDRHFYNWGVIDTSKKTEHIPIFVPI